MHAVRCVGCCAVDAILVLSNVFVIAIGSYSFFKCIQKRGKTLAKMGDKMLHHNSSGKPSITNAKVHPL